MQAYPGQGNDLDRYIAGRGRRLPARGALPLRLARGGEGRVVADVVRSMAEGRGRSDRLHVPPAGSTASSTWPGAAIWEGRSRGPWPAPASRAVGAGLRAGGGSGRLARGHRARDELPPQADDPRHGVAPRAGTGARPDQGPHRRRLDREPRRALLEVELQLDIFLRAVRVRLRPNADHAAAEPALERADGLPFEPVDGIADRVRLGDRGACQTPAPVLVVALRAGQVQPGRSGVRTARGRARGPGRGAGPRVARWARPRD